MPIIPDNVIVDALKRFHSQFGLEATPQAGWLIQELLNTILYDPDPRWGPQTPAAREKVVHKLVENLPEILLTIAKEEQTGPRVTASDVLHWLNIQVPPKLHTFGFVFDKN